jgi:hypothetical protein
VRRFFDFDFHPKRRFSVDKQLVNKVMRICFFAALTLCKQRIREDVTLVGSSGFHESVVDTFHLVKSSSESGPESCIPSAITMTEIPKTMSEAKSVTKELVNFSTNSRPVSCENTDQQNPERGEASHTIITLLVITAIVIVAVLVVWYLRKRRRSMEDSDTPVDGEGRDPLLSGGSF